MYHICKSLNIGRYAEEFSRRGFVQVPGLLEESSAERVLALLESQDEWNLAFRRQEQHVDLSFKAYKAWDEEQKRTLSNYIWENAQSDFGYFYKSIPVYDIYTKKLLPGNALNFLYELVNSQRFLSYMRELVNDVSIEFADVQATSYESGHFLKIHDDDVAGKHRVAAYVINLTKNWSADWGGLFHLFNSDGEIVESQMPVFNAINVFKVPQKHSVSYVTPFATASRYSITGWLRRGGDSL